MRRDYIINILTVIIIFFFILPTEGQNNLQLLTKPNLKVLDLGNSYTNDITVNLPALVNNMNVDVSDMCLYKVILPNARFKDWYDLINGDYSRQNIQYDIVKIIGGLTADTEVGSFNSLDNTTFLHLLSSNEWDLIIIHQQSAYAPYFDSWCGEGIGGKLNELLSMLRELQPQASFGTYLVHSYSDDYSYNDEGSSCLRWQLISNSVKKMTEDYDIDFVLPYGTAIENLRRSSLNNEKDLTRDGSHLALGLSRYTGACCYYEALLAPRTHVSMMGNNYRLSFEETSTTFISVTDENAPIAQEAVRLAMEDWYHCVNPEDPTDVAEKYIAFKDSIAKTICLSNWDNDGDGLFSEDEAAEVEDIGTVFKGDMELKSFKELSYFTNLKEIPESAFEGCEHLNSIIIPKNVSKIGPSAFNLCYLLEEVSMPEKLIEIDDKAFYACVNLKGLTIPNNLERLGEKAFYYCNSIQEITLPGTLSFVGEQALNSKSLKTVYNEGTVPLSIASNTFSENTYSDGKLLVPFGTGQCYEEALGWSNFNSKEEAITPKYETITIPDNEGNGNGYTTYSSLFGLDFSDVTGDDFKAYIIDGYDTSINEVTTKKVYEVPANTGLLIHGKAGKYKVHTSDSESITTNMLVGVPLPTMVYQSEYNYTNLLLSRKDGEIGFQTLMSDDVIGPHKAYLRIPTSTLSSIQANFTGIHFDDDTSAIRVTNSLEADDFYYTLSGVRISHPKRGLYIRQGRKVVAKK
jgi:hypothetical protein